MLGTTARHRSACRAPTPLVCRQSPPHTEMNTQARAHKPSRKHSSTSLTSILKLPGTTGTRGGLPRQKMRRGDAWRTRNFCGDNALSQIVWRRQELVHTLKRVIIGHGVERARSRLRGRTRRFRCSADLALLFCVVLTQFVHNRLGHQSGQNSDAQPSSHCVRWMNRISVSIHNTICVPHTNFTLRSNS